MTKPVLVTLTACSAGGKSYLFDYIRDVAKLPCLISTTTRAPRAREIHGRDYFFITEEESIKLEQEGGLAELAIYNGARYGVTNEEFHSKLESGLAFLIVEPSGIEHYAKPAVDVGAAHLKVWIEVDLQTRMNRFTERAQNDIIKAAMTMNPDTISKAVNTALKRQKSMLTEELGWFNMAKWDRVVDGENTPDRNLALILSDVDNIRFRASCQ